MCGIAAIFAYHRTAPCIDRSLLARTCERMQCRGPDGQGLWLSDDARVGLGHRRLSIIDLSDRGAQPMRGVHEQHVISFNGEIYNYRALRSDLERKGHCFHTESDTEVMLHLYQEKGESFVQDLRGMFAFALWDGCTQRLLLARDPFGIKPLYFADDGRVIRAASEVKALVGTGGVDTAPDPAGHVGFFLWGHVPEPYTLYKGVRSLPAGSTMWVDASGPHPPQRYADLAELLCGEEAERETLSASELREQLREALLDSVEHHLVADVDVGVFLSAGIDSTTLLALAAERRARLRTVTLGFEEFRGTPHDETPLAEAVAKRYGADHRTVWITRNDFRRELPRLVDRMDQPTIDGVNSYFVAQAAASAGLKVALSGLGGDELFGGYPSFRQIPRLVAALNRVPAVAVLGRGIRRVSAPLMGRVISPKYAGLLEYGGDFAGAYLLRRGLFLPWELETVLDIELVREGLGELRARSELARSIAGITTDRLRVSALEAGWYMRNQLLRDTDWASMSHSLEVRVPLVDWTLWRRVVPLIRAASTGRVDKQMLARTPATPLPEEIIRRAKTGFGTPTREWLDQEQGRPGRGLRGWAHYVYGAAA
jgi:asparagine synthase (glutamine-hydrolysing)